MYYSHFGLSQEHEIATHLAKRPARDPQRGAHGHDAVALRVPGHIGNREAEVPRERSRHRGARNAKRGERS